jgi:hypothetical protein
VGELSKDWLKLPQLVHRPELGLLPLLCGDRGFLLWEISSPRP